MTFSELAINDLFIINRFPEDGTARKVELESHPQWPAIKHNAIDLSTGYDFFVHHNTKVTKVEGEK